MAKRQILKTLFLQADPDWCKQDLFLQGPYPWIIVKNNIMQWLLALSNVIFFVHFLYWHVNYKLFLPPFFFFFSEMWTDVQLFKKLHITVDCILSHTTTSTEWMQLWKCTKKMQSKEILPGLPGCTSAILIFSCNLLQLAYHFLN